MADNEYGDLSDPILDVSPLSIGDVDDHGDYHSVQDDKDVLASVLEDHDLGGRTDEYVEEDGQNIDDYDIMFSSVDSIIGELRAICDGMGVPCTAPMENMMAMKFKTEPIRLSGVIWFVRGVSMATNTQVIPTVISAIDDMKAENRLLQQSTHKINKEVEKATRTAGDIAKQLSSIKADMQESFRESIQTFMKAERDHFEHYVKERFICTTEKASPPAEEKKEEKKPLLTEIEVPSASVSIGPENVTRKKQNKITDEKRKYLITFGYAPSAIKEMDDGVIDFIVMDDLLTYMRDMKPTKDAKKVIIDLVNDRLEELLSGNA